MRRGRTPRSRPICRRRTSTPSAAAQAACTTSSARSPTSCAIRRSASFDRYALLDAQDWMNDAELTALWSEITRTARPGARVIFRTAAAERLLPGRVPDDLLGVWRYEDELSRELTRQDRSSIYGAFHLYALEGD